MGGGGGRGEGSYRNIELFPQNYHEERDFLFCLFYYYFLVGEGGGAALQQLQEQ